MLYKLCNMLTKLYVYDSSNLRCAVPECLNSTLVAMKTYIIFSLFHQWIAVFIQLLLNPVWYINKVSFLVMIQIIYVATGFNTIMCTFFGHIQTLSLPISFMPSWVDIANFSGILRFGDIILLGSIRLLSCVTFS